MTSKRYVLLQADGEATPDAWKELAHHLEQRFGKIKAIPVRGNGSVMVVKTDNLVAPLIRESEGMRVGGLGVRSVLTSGSIGKLKRAASHGAV